MIRGTMVARSIKEIKDVFDHLKQMNLIRILQIQNHLKSNKQNIIINFIWKDQNEYYNEETGQDQGKAHESIIGEIQIRFADKQTDYYANQFLNRLINSDSLP